MHDSNTKSDHEIEKAPIPPELQIQIPELAADNVLDMTTSIRYQMLRQYLADGQLPKDVKEASVVVKLLDGLDKQDLTKKRLDIEKDNASSNNEIARAALDLASRLSEGRNANPYERAPSNTPQVAPKLDTELTKDITVTEGEKSWAPRDFNKKPETGTAAE